MIKSCFDLEGEVFGEWTVIAKVARPDHWSENDKHSFWLCECSCGHKSIIVGFALRAGRSRSCGCRILNQSSDSKQVLSADAIG